MGMEVLQQVWPFMLALVVLAAVTFLRVLALDRSQQIDHYDLARTANQLHRAHEEQKRRLHGPINEA